MPLDPSIALQVKPGNFMSPADAISLQNLARQGKMQEMQMAEQQRGMEDKNALRQFGTDPANLDPSTGAPSAAGIQKLWGINPAMAGQAAEHRQASLAHLATRNLQLTAEQEKFQKELTSDTVSAYDLALKRTGGNAEEAMRAAQSARLARLEDLDKSGRRAAMGLTDTAFGEAKNKPIDIEQLRSFITSPKDIASMENKDETPYQRDLKASLKAQGLKEGTPEWNTKFSEGINRRMAREEAPTKTMISLNTPKGGEEQAGLSKQYGTDEDYKAKVNFWAKVIADGGVLPPRFAQSGAGKKMMPDILNVVPTLAGDSKTMLANQVDMTGQKSEARAVGTRSAAVEMAAGEAREMMPILQTTSENFARTGYQPINKVLMSFKNNTGNVESRQFGSALNSFINVYARAISPTGSPTVSDKDHARELLSTADSHEQLMGILKVMDQEMNAALAAPKRVRAAQREGITGKPAEGKPEAKPSSGWKDL